MSTTPIQVNKEKRKDRDRQPSGGRRGYVDSSVKRTGP